MDNVMTQAQFDELLVIGIRQDQEKIAALELEVNQLRVQAAQFANLRAACLDLKAEVISLAEQDGDGFMPVPVNLLIWRIFCDALDAAQTPAQPEQPAADSSVDRAWQRFKSAVDTPYNQVDELAMIARRLAHALRKASPDSDLPKTTLDYLAKQCLLGSPLREQPAPIPTSERLPMEAASMRPGFLYLWVLPHGDIKAVWLHEDKDGTELREFDDAWFFDCGLVGYLLPTGLTRPDDPEVVA